jgi:hypothetical protein
VTNTFVDATIIEAGDFNANFTDLVTFLNDNVVHVDGSKAFTAVVSGVDPTADAHLATRKFADTGFFQFSFDGDLEVTTGTHRAYLPYDLEIIEVEASVGVAPTGAAVIVDVNVDGTTVFTTQSNRPEIAISGFVDSSTTIEDDTHTDGQYLTVDIDQIGSTLPGEDLTVTVRYRRT